MIFLRDGFLHMHWGATFYVEPHSPHPFSGKFGFYEVIPIVLFKDPHTRVVSYDDAFLYWKQLLFLGTMSQGILPSHSLTLIQYISSAYRICWSKVTINVLRPNTSILQKSTEANSSKQEKDVEAGSSKKANGKKGKGPMVDLDAEGPESSDDAHRSPGFHLADRKRGLVQGSDREPKSDVNFRHGGARGARL